MILSFFVICQVGRHIEKSIIHSSSCNSELSFIGSAQHNIDIHIS